MIISASRRTDIPAFYSDWFYERIKEGFVLVRNPMNPTQVSRVSLRREVVDCIVFWTKNPQSMLQKLHMINDYKYYFQFTLNSFDNRMEPCLPKIEVLIDVFKRLSDKLGPGKVIWRYDPIIINRDISVEYHIECFNSLAATLKGYTEKCVISFIDYYKKIDKNYKAYNMCEIDYTQKKEIALHISEIARANRLEVQTCAESIDLSEYGIGHARCIDPEFIENIAGVKADLRKDCNQREYCGCAASIDIGAYNTCTHGCVYCYANHSAQSVKRNILKYDISSPLLCSCLTESDRVIVRDVR